jgi:hypothetical protein
VCWIVTAVHVILGVRSRHPSDLLSINQCRS